LTGLRKLTAWHQLADSCALLSRERFTGLPAFEVLEEGRAGVRAAAASRKVGRSCGTINVTPSAGQPGAFAAPRNPKLTCDGATREAPRKKETAAELTGGGHTT